MQDMFHGSDAEFINRSGFELVLDISDRKKSVIVVPIKRIIVQELITVLNFKDFIHRN